MPKNAFTLVELMIAVAIAGLLAAIAIPNYIEMQYRARRAEVPPIVDALKTAELAYDAANDRFLPIPEHPPGGPSGKKAVPWGNGNAAFQELGWAPSGHVRGAYRVSTTPSTVTPGGDFQARGRCDVDGNGVHAVYTATKSINTTFLNDNDTY